MNMGGRRRRRNHRNTFGRREKLNFKPVIILLCLSVGCGYAAAKYVVDPVVNYVPQLMAERQQELSDNDGDKNVTQTEADDNEKDVDTVEDQVDVESKGDVKGYAVQFGCYSGKGAAEAVMPTIGVDGLQVIEQNDMYKIVGEIYDTKEKAEKARAQLPESVKSFITTVYR